MSRFFASLFLLVALLLAPPLRASELTITFFDIGQGDSALVVSPTGKRVLIDGGPPEGTPALIAELARRNIDRLDLMLLSHPHLDHLGGLRKVLDHVSVALFIDAGYPSTSPPYQALLKALQEKNVPVAQAMIGRNIDLGDGAALRLLGPPSPWLSNTRSDVNANSVLVRLVWRDRTALFAGDAEPETERWLLERYRSEPALLRAEVLKVPHHGGKYSSTAPFLAAVAPRLAVISVAAVNDYHHPTPEAMGRLQQAGARLYRTDQAGTITLRSRDGQPWAVELSKSAAGVATAPPPATVSPAPAPPPATTPAATTTYLGSQRSPVFHRADCPGGQKIQPQNLLRWSSRAAALASGRRPAEDCHP